MRRSVKRTIRIVTTTTWSVQWEEKTSPTTPTDSIPVSDPAEIPLTFSESHLPSETSIALSESPGIETSIPYHPLPKNEPVNQA